MVSQAREIELHYRVEPAVDAWVLPEGQVPEARDHDLLAHYLVEVLVAWVERRALDAIVARNLAIRWIEDRPRVGVDPDVCVVAPAPPGERELTSLCTWRAGHAVPRLGVEVVSQGHPYKDYTDIQDKYAACGIPELWVLDPRLIGPRRFGGPFRLQAWRADAGRFQRVHAGDGPYCSPAVGGWIRVVGTQVLLSDDAAAEHPWLTRAEAERAEKEAERAEKEAERAERMALETRVRELEARLGRGKAPR